MVVETVVTVRCNRCGNNGSEQRLGEYKLVLLRGGKAVAQTTEFHLHLGCLEPVTALVSQSVSPTWSAPKVTFVAKRTYRKRLSAPVGRMTGPPRTAAEA